MLKKENPVLDKDDLPVNEKVLSISAASLQASLLCIHSPLHKCVGLDHRLGTHTHTITHTLAHVHNTRQMCSSHSLEILKRLRII